MERERIIEFGKMIERTFFNEGKKSFLELREFALFEYYFYKLTRNEIYIKKSNIVLNKIHNEFKIETLNNSLWYGNSSILLLNDIMLSENKITNQQIIKKIIDDSSFLLKNTAFINKNHRVYDQFYGIGGIINVLLNNQEDISVKNIINQLINHLIYLIKNINGLPINKTNIYIHKKDYINKNMDIMYPKGYIDFGSAHGISSILSILCLAYKSGYNLENIKCAIIELTEFIFKNLIKKNKSEIYYGKLENNLGWCYGEMGIVMSLVKSNDLFYDYSIDNYIESFFIQLNNTNNFNQDTYFCHGIAGVLHMINVFEMNRTKLEIKKTILNELELRIKEEILLFADKNTRLSMLDGLISIFIPLVINEMGITEDDIFSKYFLLL